MLIDFTKSYALDDLTRAVRAAHEENPRVYLARRILGEATSADRAAALEAWQRVAELAAWFDLHAEDNEARKAAQEAGELAKRERARLAALPMADDTRVDDAMRGKAITAAEGRSWKRLPHTIRCAIRGHYIPASPDDSAMCDRFEADVLALTPSRIVCAPRPENTKFELNTEN